MPLRDHFHPPLSIRKRWDALHGGWPMTIATALNVALPAEYTADPLVHLGSAVEIDVGTFEGRADAAPAGAIGQTGGTAVWAPPRPTRTLEVALPDADEYEVRVYSAADQQLVAAVKLISPSNKDRPEHRRDFVAKCVALLRQQVSVVIVDVVSERAANLCRELFDALGRPESSPATESRLYAVALRYAGVGRKRRLRTWEESLEVGRPLPTLPLWLNDDDAVPLELEASYESACRALKIG